MSGTKRGNKKARYRLKQCLRELGGSSGYRELLDYYNQKDKFGMTIYKFWRLVQSTEGVKVEEGTVVIGRE